MNPSYIAKNLEELFDNAPLEIQQLLESGEVNKTTAILGKVYKLPISLYVALSNIISFILIGALKPEDVVTAIEDILKLPQDEAFKLAEDLEKSILEKARIKILKKSPTEMVTLSFPETAPTDELRKEILDTTKRESGLVKDQSVPEPSTPIKKQVVLTPGSRSQLLEQLQVIGQIPDDEEIGTRLEHIKEQIASLDSKSKPESLDSNVALQEFMFGDKGKTVVEAEARPSSYSKAPTRYNVDPYREVVGN
ncbi:MAG: hypothetical protein WCT07_01375 [Candidatus Paceibacterota bacterium]|jgi:hypothetical protein